MNRATYDKAEKIVNRMDKLEKTIFELQDIINQKSYRIISSTNDEVSIADVPLASEKVVDLKSGEIATEVFVQGVMDYYINLLNLELDELKKEFEEIKSS